MYKLIYAPILLLLVLASVARAEVFSWSTKADFEGCTKVATITDRNRTLYSAYAQAEVSLSARLPEFNPRTFLGIGNTLASAGYPRIYSCPDKTLRLYYTLTHDFSDIKLRISYDGGIHWEEQVLALGSVDHPVKSPALVMLAPDHYVLYYCRQTQSPGGNWEVVFSESQDGKRFVTPFVRCGLADSGQNIENVYALDNSGIRLYFDQIQGGINDIYCAYGSSDGIKFNQVQALGIGSGNTITAVHAPFLWPLPEGGYRLYYHWDNGACSQIGYRESLDGLDFSSAPQVLLGIGSPGEDAREPFVFQPPNQTQLKIYYASTTTGAAPWDLASQSSDFDFSGWQPAPNWKIGTETQYAAQYAATPFIFQEASGRYRLFYAENDVVNQESSGWSLVYRTSTDLNTWSQNATKTFIGDGRTNALAPNLLLDLNGYYRLYYRSIIAWVPLNGTDVVGNMSLVCLRAATLDGLLTPGLPKDTVVNGPDLSANVDSPFVFIGSDIQRPYQLLYRSWHASDLTTASYSLMLRTSADGLKDWSSDTALDLSAGSDQQGQEEFIWKNDDDGFSLLYNWGPAGTYRQLAILHSSDGVHGWTQRSLMGIPNNQSCLNNPWSSFLYRLPDGTFRLYYSQDTQGGKFPFITYYSHPGIHSASGTLTSRVLDGKAAKSWTKISWEQNLPPNTSICLRVRAGNSPAPDSTWCGWQGNFSNAGGTELHAVSGRYFQWQAALKSSDWKTTPRLLKVSVENGPYVPMPVIPDKQIKAFPSRINPAKGESAAIRWYQPESTGTTIRIYTLRGELVTTLADNQDFSKSQQHELIWRGLNTSGSQVASGIYIVYIRSGSWEDRIKVAAIK